MSPRHFLSWKPLFYQVFLPVFRQLGPRRCDAILSILGRVIITLWPSRGMELTQAIDRADRALDAGWDREAVRRDLASSLPQFAARDYLLDGLDEATALGRFDVEGEETLQAALKLGRGAIIVGSHLGGHVAGLHWLYRRGVPLRVLVQRPNHVSSYLQSKFDEPNAHPQRHMFLKRGLPPCQAVDRMLRAHAALRDGLAIYFTGDIPWEGPNTRPGRLLGRETEFLSVWADLAALTKAPVFLLLNKHLPGGRYRLSLEPLGVLRPGEEGLAVAQFLARLDAEIVSNPSEAVAHLLWHHYNPSEIAAKPSRKPKPRPAPMIVDHHIETKSHEVEVNAVSSPPH